MNQKCYDFLTERIHRISFEPIRKRLTSTRYEISVNRCDYQLEELYWNWLTPNRIVTVCSSSCGKVIFSKVCVKNSVHRGLYPSMHWGQTPPGRYPSMPWDRHPLCRYPSMHCGRHPLAGRHPPEQADNPPPPTATAADGTHPTGMLSCLFWISRR